MDNREVELRVAFTMADVLARLGEALLEDESGDARELAHTLNGTFEILESVLRENAHAA